MGYMVGLGNTKTDSLVGLVEVLGGSSFLFDKCGALMALILTRPLINAVLLHATLVLATIPGSLIPLVLYSHVNWLQEQVPGYA